MIELIVAAGLGEEIGKDNKLLWNLKDDMKHFVKTTKGKNVVMGRKTFESLPNGPLKGRHNYVLTKEKRQGIVFDENTSVKYLTYEELMNIKDLDFVVIGGAEVYNLFMANADIIHYTLVLHIFPQADTFISNISYGLYDVIESECYPANEHNDYPFCIMKMKKCRI